SLRFLFFLREDVRELGLRDDGSLREPLLHDVGAVFGNAKQIDRKLARFSRLREIVGGLERVGRGTGEVDRDGVGLLLLRELEEPGPAGLRHDDMGAALCEFLHPSVALGVLKMKVEDAHRMADYSND